MNKWLPVKKEDDSLSLAKNFPALVQGRTDTLLRDPVSLATAIYVGLAYIGITGPGLAVIASQVIAYGLISAAMWGASSLLAAATSKQKAGTTFASGLLINSRQPSDSRRLGYGQFKTGGEWGWWGTESLSSSARNEMLHVVVGWCWGVCEVAKDFEPPFFAGSGKSGLINKGPYTGSTSNEYKIVIHTGGTTFKWSDDGGTTWITPVTITGDWQDLSNGIKIKFIQGTSGYTPLSSWQFFAGDGLWVGDRLYYYYQKIKTIEGAPCVIWHTFHSGAANQAVDTELATSFGYTNAHTYYCYSHFKLKMPAATDVVVWKSIPEFRAVLRKIDIYDPRGPSTGFSNNNALIARDYYLNTVYGAAKSSSLLNAQSVLDAANWCEEEDHPMTFNGVFFNKKEHVEILDEILRNGRMFRVDNGGEEKIKAWDDDSPAMPFFHDSLHVDENEVDIDPASFSIAIQGIPETYNRVVCSFWNRKKGYIYDEQKYEDLTQIGLDGEIKELKLELVGCDNALQAKRIAKFTQKRSKYSNRFSILGHPKCYPLEQGDMIVATHEFPAWTAKKVRLDCLGVQQQAMVPMVVMDENAEIYDPAVDLSDEEGGGYTPPGPGDTGPDLTYLDFYGENKPSSIRTWWQYQPGHGPEDNLKTWKIYRVEISGEYTATPIWQPTGELSPGTLLAKENLRNVALSMTDDATKIRVKIMAHNVDDTIITGASIGLRLGQTEDFDGAPTRFFFGGAAGCTIPAGTSRESDWTNFIIDKTKQYLIHLYCDMSPSTKIMCFYNAP